MCVTWLFHVCELTQWLILVYAMTNSCVWHDSFVSVRGLIHVCERDMTYATDDLVLQPPHNSFMCMTWLVYYNYFLDMTRSSLSFVWHDLFMCVTWLIRVCAMTHSNYHMTHSCVWRTPFSDMSYSYDMTHVCVHHKSYSRHHGTPTTPWCHGCDMTHSYVWHDSFMCVTWVM